MTLRDGEKPVSNETKSRPKPASSTVPPSPPANTRRSTVPQVEPSEHRPVHGLTQKAMPAAKAEEDQTDAMRQTQTLPPFPPPMPKDRQTVIPRRETQEQVSSTEVPTAPVGTPAAPKTVTQEQTTPTQAAPATPKPKKVVKPSVAPVKEETVPALAEEEDLVIAKPSLLSRLWSFGKKQGGGSGGGDDKPPKAKKPLWWRILRKTLIWVPVSLVALITFILLFVIFLPLNTIKDFAMPSVRDAINHQNLDVGEIDFNLFGGFVIRDIRVGPPEKPAGFTKDILRVDEVNITYAILSAVFSNEVTLENVLLKNITVDIESLPQDDGRFLPSFQALLDNMPKSEPSPPPPPDEPQPMVLGEEAPGPLALPEFHIVAKKIGLENFQLDADLGEMEAHFRQFSTVISADIHTTGAVHVELHTDIHGTEPGQNNLVVAMADLFKPAPEGDAAPAPDTAQPDNADKPVPAPADEGAVLPGSPGDDALPGQTANHTPTPLELQSQLDVDVDLVLDSSLARLTNINELDKVIEDTKIDFDVGFGFKVNKFTGPVELPGTELRYGLSVAVDGKTGEMGIDKMDFTFNGEEFVNFDVMVGGLKNALPGFIDQIAKEQVWAYEYYKAKIAKGETVMQGDPSELTDEQKKEQAQALNTLVSQLNVGMDLKSFRIPLESFHPYVNPIFPNLVLKGEVLVKNRVVVKGPESIDPEKIQADLQHTLDTVQPLTETHFIVKDLNIDLDLSEAKLPAIAGDVVIDAPPAKITDFDLDVTVYTRLGHAESQVWTKDTIFEAMQAESAADYPPIHVRTIMDMAALDGFGAHIANFHLDNRIGVTAKLETHDMGFPAPEWVCLTNEISIPTVRYYVPGQGMVAIRFDHDMKLGGNLREMDWDIERITANISDTVKVKIAAQADLNTTATVLNRSDLAVDLDPIDFRRAMRLAPPKALAPLRQMKLKILSGSFGSHVGVKTGRIDFATVGAIGQRNPSALPVELDIAATLDKISIFMNEKKNHQAAAKKQTKKGEKAPAEPDPLEVRNFGGTLRIHGPIKNLAIETTGPGLGVEFVQIAHGNEKKEIYVEGIRIPIHVLAKNTDDIDSSLKVQADVIRVRPAALEIANLEFRTGGLARAPGIVGKAGRGAKFRVKKAQGDIGLSIGKLNMAKNLTVELEGMNFGASVGYEANREDGFPLKSGVNIGLDRFRYEEMDVTATGISVDAELGIHVPDLDLPPEPTLFTPISKALDLPDKIQTTLQIRAQQALLPNMPAPFNETIIDVKSVIHNLETAVLEKFDIRVPTAGVRVDVDGKVMRLRRTILNQLERGLIVLPEYDVQMFSGLDTSEGFQGLESSEPNWKKLPLPMEDYFTQGLVGIKARVRSIPNTEEAVMEGVILAKAFNFWKKDPAKKKIKYDVGDGKLVTLWIDSQSAMYLKDMDADVPLIQKIRMVFADGVPKVWLLGEQRSLFDMGSKGALYNTMREYSKNRSNFHIDGVTLTTREEKAKLAYKRQKKMKDTDPEAYALANSATPQRRRWKTGDYFDSSLRVDEVSLDMIYNDNIFAIDRLYVNVLGGDVQGQLQAQLYSPDFEVSNFPPPEFTVRTHFGLQLTNVNLAYLTAGPDTKVTDETAISMLMDLDFDLRPKFVEGRIELTQLGIPQAIQGMKFLDPNKQDPSIQRNIGVLKMADGVAGLDFASIRLKYTQANVDFALNGFFGPIINFFILDKIKIRNFDIMPILSNNLDPVIAGLTPQPKEDKEGDIAQELAKKRAEEERKRKEEEQRKLEEERKKRQQERGRNAARE